MTDNTNPQQADNRFTNRWQQKLLPWFVIMPTLLIGVFIFLATRQLEQFNEKLQTVPDSTLMGLINPSVSEAGSLSQGPELDKRYLINILTYLEHESSNRRYNQGALLLMSRIFTKYLGFFTGMILAIVGAVFIIGKIREDSSNINADLNEMLKFSVVSSSPGVIFGILGTILMLATILKHNDITVQDSPLYLNQNTILATEILNHLADDTTKINAANLEAMKGIFSVTRIKRELKKPDSVR